MSCVYLVLLVLLSTNNKGQSWPKGLSVYELCSVLRDLNFLLKREELINELRFGNKNVLYGTQAIFSEGISINELSCLILGTPINNEPLLTQLIGRIIRKEEDKPTPVIIDIHLKGDTARRQASNRVGYYMKQGYEIKEL